MIRGTTPTFTFTADIDCTQLDLLWVTFKQQDEEVFTKELPDCVIDGNVIKVTLSEKDTLMFDHRKNPVKIQLRAGIGKIRTATDPMYTIVKEILKDGCLE